MIVVIGGQARNVGKTTAVCDIIQATPELDWVAIKVTPHSHGEAPSADVDTERFLAAGAREAHLLHDPADLPSTGNLIIESNSVVEHLRPDLFVFVLNHAVPEWKASATRVFSQASIVVESRITPATLQEIRAILTDRVARSQRSAG
jgi:hypothetical protein